MSSAKSTPEAARAVLDFWFGTPESPAWNVSRREWFANSDAFDENIRARFLSLWQAACDGAADEWSVTAEGACARIVLLDQFPRNMFRSDARSFATDGLALELAQRMILEGLDHQLPTPWHRVFCYLPFEHAESLEAQEISVRETQALRDETGGKVDVVEWAVRHREIIARFARFPHRNAVLGRQSSTEELHFLSQPGSSF